MDEPKSPAIASGQLLPFEPKDISRTSPIIIEATQQRMKSYSITEDQLEFLGGASGRFTVLSNVCALFLSSALSTFLSGITSSRHLVRPRSPCSE